MPAKSRLAAIVLTVAIGTIVFYSAWVHGARLAHLESYYAVGDVPELTASVFPFVQFTPAFLIGAVPAFLVLVAGSLTPREKGILLSVSAFILVALIAWMGVVYLAIDVVYFKFQPV